MADETSETFRGGVHFLMGGLACALCLYNVMRFAEVKGAAHVLNASAYAALVALEIVNTKQHWSRT